jgi:hypothetical protein
VTKKLEDFFNLPPASIPDVEPEMVEEPVRSVAEVMDEAKEIYSALTTAEKVDFSLPTVVGLEIHDSEMDDISSKALKTFDDLISLGNNVPDVHAGKIYEVANQMLTTALNARNSKADKKLKLIELQLKKLRAEQIDREAGQGPHNNGIGAEFDRNDLLKYMIEAKKSEKSDK